MKRRTFLKAAGSAVPLGACLGDVELVEGAGVTVALAVDPADPIATAAPSKWAITELLTRLQARGIESRLVTSASQALPGEICIMASGPTLTAPAVMPAVSRPPAAAESFTISSAALVGAGGRRVIMAAGRDPRGLVYALLELADRLDNETTPAAAFQITRPEPEQPANRARGVLRAFVSEVEDKPWFYDRAGWRDYLTMLATHRFNRFNLSFGMGYDSTSEIRDAYLHFLYPFLLDVPGYNVGVTITPPFGGKPDLLGDDERARNLSLLQYIAAAVVERGMDFQLGIWNHAWNFDAAPHASHRITGLTPANHAAYCRDALNALLVACPAISGVTLRTNGKSGVPEKNYTFWKTVFSGIAATGLKIGVDQDGEGISAEMIALAQTTKSTTTQSTKMPPATVSPKYWAGHMGLPYHQAAIRTTEASRDFMRYGYGNLLRDDRTYTVLHRIWPGTQRLLLWGDPLMAAAYGRASGFCGSGGVEWMEPLSFRGRGGSGLAGGRDGYAGLAASDKPDWDKYLYTYRVWGRGIYNPESSPEGRKRYLRKALGASADSAEAALALSSRILPTIATAHMPSASDASYWPEMYSNQSIVIAGATDPYIDTPEPRRFGTVSPADPQLFCTVEQCADELLQGTQGARYSPIEVASWLEELAQDSENNLAVDTAGKTPVFRQWAVDIAIHNGIGRFFAAKFRAGVLYAIYTRTFDPAALEEAIKAYNSARAAWKQIATIANGVYRPDLTFGYAPHLRGTWRDRIEAMDRDIAAMTAAQLSAPVTSATAAIVAAISTPHRDALLLQHTPVKRFRPGVPIAIEAALPAGIPGKLNLLYRRVNQAERWVTLAMESSGPAFHAAIPAEYTASPYPLQYYFEAHFDSGGATLYPGLARDYSTPPYFLIRRV